MRLAIEQFLLYQAKAAKTITSHGVSSFHLSVTKYRNFDQ